MFYLCIITAFSVSLFITMAHLPKNVFRSMLQAQMASFAILDISEIGGCSHLVSARMHAKPAAVLIKYTIAAF